MWGLLHNSFFFHQLAHLSHPLMVISFCYLQVVVESSFRVILASVWKKGANSLHHSQIYHKFFQCQEKKGRRALHGCTHRKNLIDNLVRQMAYCFLTTTRVVFFFQMEYSMQEYADFQTYLKIIKQVGSSRDFSD